MQKTQLISKGFPRCLLLIAASDAGSVLSPPDSDCQKAVVHTAPRPGTGRASLIQHDIALFFPQIIRQVRDERTSRLFFSLPFSHVMRRLYQGREGSNAEASFILETIPQPTTTTTLSPTIPFHISPASSAPTSQNKLPFIPEFSGGGLQQQLPREKRKVSTQTLAGAREQLLITPKVTMSRGCQPDLPIDFPRFVIVPGSRLEL